MKNKKYKLLNWYPSLPKCLKKGTEVIRYLGDDDYVSCNELCPGSIPYFEVEKNPEFWEEVVEKDYEILSFKDKFSGEKIFYSSHPKSRPLNNMYYCNEGNWLGFSKSRIIHSVKRLSDGEIFTVGDKVDSVHFRKGQNETITSFQLTEDISFIYRIVVHTTWNVENPNGQIFRDIISIKPIFTTTDGVDIYEGDKFYPVALTDGYGYLPYEVCNQRWSSRPKHDWAFKYFSTKEKAEEWIEDNQPKYSKVHIKESMIKWFENKSRLNRIDIITGKPMSLKLTDEFIEELENSSD